MGNGVLPQLESKLSAPTTPHLVRLDTHAAQFVSDHPCAVCELGTENTYLHRQRG